MVDIFRKPDAIAQIVDEAIKRGDVDTVWMQLGLVNNEKKRKIFKSTQKAKDAGFKNQIYKINVQR